MTEVSKAKRPTTKRKTTRGSKSKEDKISVEQIIIERLLQVIEEDNELPWMKPWTTPCMNWYTKREYRGINVALLQAGSGEYLTFKQLLEHNAKNGTDFRVKKGSKVHYIQFSDTKSKEITASQAQKLINEGYGNFVIQVGDIYYRKTSILKYFKVFDIKDIATPEGEHLKSHLENGVQLRFSDADKVVEDYLQESGVSLNHHRLDKAFYRKETDGVYMPNMQYFANSGAYYRVLFHELIHSTGVTKRLNRKCYEDYHKDRTIRSKEELVAEVGSMFLTARTGIREENKSDLWDYNQENYILSWVQYIKNNPKEVLSAFGMAERAKNYIMGVTSEEGATEVSINQKKQATE